MARLRIRRSDGDETIHELQRDGDVLLGRSGDCDIVLDGQKVSRRHCVLEHKGDGWVLRDAGSSNGTTVNGEKVATRVLEGGETIMAGDATFTFESDVSPAARAAAKSPSLQRTTRGAERRRSRGPGIGAIVGVVLVAVVAVVALGWWGRLNRAHETFQDADKHRMAGEWAEAEKDYNEYLNTWPEGADAAAARKGLAAVRSERDRLARADEALENARRVALSLDTEHDAAVGLFERIREEYPDTPAADEAESELAALAERREAAIERLRDRILRRAQVRVDDGDYAQALRTWEVFLAENPSFREDEQVVDAMRAIHDRAGTAAETLLAEARDLREDDPVTAQRLLAEAAGRFPLRGRIQLRETVLAWALTTADRSGEAEARRLLEARREVIGELAEVDDLAAARRWDEALDILDGLLGRVDAGALQAELTARRDQVAAQHEQHAALVRSVADGRMADQPVTLASGLTVRLVADEGDAVRVAISGAESRVPWQRLEAPTLHELYGRLPGADEAVGLWARACFAFEQAPARDRGDAMSRDAHTLLHSCLRKDPSRQDGAFLLLSRVLGTAVPDDGFVYYDDLWMTPTEKAVAERDKAIADLVRRFRRTDSTEEDRELMTALAEYGDPAADDFVKTPLAAALNDRREQALEALQNTRNWKNTALLRREKEKLNTAREAALEVIFDKEIYPDEDHGRVGQPQVDEAVDKVKDIWNQKFDDLARLNPAVEELVRTVERMEALLAEIGASVRETDVTLELIKLNASRDMSLRDFALDNAEQKLIDKNREVEKFNAEFVANHPDTMSANEVEQVRVTNDYREMMGLQRVYCNAKLGAAARKHSEWMQSVNRLSHTQEPGSPTETPGKRCALEGYTSYTGENCAQGYADPKAVFKGWYNSSGHHRNMLGKGHRALGVGQAGTWWTQDFGSVAELD